ncbi:concanavalin A-like lectin/glucanase domain-containing protein [Scheffersomyces coipomensis]|uniref:concanavalin A-like lectin/glucanase domain-containing protein n=1 Tax=Scheffersomyces coipomensis TaxID=1788519 RepID=UPI00315D67DD
MGLLTSIKRSRPLQLILLLLGLGLIFYIFPSYITFSNDETDSYSPEELNSILQNKDEEITLLKKVELTAQSLSTPYLEPSSFHIKNWDLNGNTMVKNNEYIRLTSANPHQSGNMFADLPIQAESFEMELTFHIHGEKAIGLIGDGLAIWFLDQKSEIGEVFGAKNFFNGLGIMIDTYKNGKRGNFPFINLMLGDGKTKYDKGSDGYDTRLAGCTTKNIYNPPGKETKMRIIYIKDGYLSIDVNYNGIHEDWTNCVTLTDVILPPVKYLGLTAETGQLYENVDILENKIFALYKPDGSFVGSIEELSNLLSEQNEFENEVKQIQEDVKNAKGLDDKDDGSRHNNRKNRPSINQKRRSLQRLRNAEKRIKERERKLRLEKYGDEDATFIKRSINNILTSIKYGVYLILFILLSWCVFIIYRVQKQKKKAKVTGLLD